MAKRDKNINIPTGSPKNTGPVMRKSSGRKLGRGFNDLMGSSYKKSSGRIQATQSQPKISSTSTKASAKTSNSRRNNSQPTMRNAPVVRSTNEAVSSVGNGSKNVSAQVNENKNDIVSSVDVGSNEVSIPNPVTGAVSVSAAETTKIPPVDNQAGMDQESIDSVMSGTPKSRSKMGTASERRAKRRKKKAKTTLLIILIIALISAAVGGFIYLYSSDYFTIEKIQINGSMHLTDNEVLALANVPDDETLIRVDTDTITQRLKRDAWIKDVNVVRAFPDTLQINITERAIAAIVEVPVTKDSSTSSSSSTSATSKNTSVRMWAISADRIWLMPIPDQNSDVGKTINQQIYADAAGILHIVDVLPSVNPEIGCYCTDPTLQCAIDVVSSMTTELKSQVKYAKASDSQSTTLVLNNGVEIAVGTNEDMRDKERIVLDLLEKHEGKISFINVRNVNNPTWRTL